MHLRVQQFNMLPKERVSPGSWERNGSGNESGTSGMEQYLSGKVSQDWIGKKLGQNRIPTIMVQNKISWTQLRVCLCP